MPGTTNVSALRERLSLLQTFTCGEFEKHILSSVYASLPAEAAAETEKILFPKSGTGIGETASILRNMMLTGTGIPDSDAVERMRKLDGNGVLSALLVVAYSGSMTEESAVEATGAAMSLARSPAEVRNVASCFFARSIPTTSSVAVGERLESALYNGAVPESTMRRCLSVVTNRLRELGVPPPFHAAYADWVPVDVVAELAGMVLDDGNSAADSSIVEILSLPDGILGDVEVEKAKTVIADVFRGNATIRMNHDDVLLFIRGAQDTRPLRYRSGMLRDDFSRGMSRGPATTEPRPSLSAAVFCR